MLPDQSAWSSGPTDGEVEVKALCSLTGDRIATFIKYSICLFTDVIWIKGPASKLRLLAPPAQGKTGAEADEQSAAGARRVVPRLG